jgi:hypothetical protein
MFDNQLVTVWSAPNYCYRCGNSASIMQVKEDGTTDFKVYLAAEENERDSKNEAARRVSCASKVSRFRHRELISLLDRACLHTLYNGQSKYGIDHRQVSAA